MTMHNPRHYRWQDSILMNVSKCIRTLLELPANHNSRPCPGDAEPQPTLSSQEKKQSGGMMRVNHTGEVCAQALYLGQSLTARTETLRSAFEEAAIEESDHLSWCEQRLTELESHKSYLNPLWFTGSLLIGTCAGLAGDKWSLGFLAETEQQVFKHLESHLEKLPKMDGRSRAIVAQMQEEEAKHAHTAISYGAAELPFFIKIGMQWMAKVMTQETYYV